MRKKLYFLFFSITLFFSVDLLYSQNLITNGDFENYISLPTAIGDVNKASNWTTPTAATPDYFNANATVADVMIPCNYFGCQSTHSGNAYCGIITYTTNPGYPGYEYREYMLQELTAPLKPGATYYFEFYVSRAGGLLEHYGTDKMGIYFSSNIVTASGGLHINVTPDYECPAVITDSDNWTKVAGCYTAANNIQFITIGNFRDNASCTALPVLPVWPGGVTRSYYYIDDVSLTEIKADFDFEIQECHSEVAFASRSSVATDFLWSFDDGTTDTVANTVHHYKKHGTYNVKLAITTGANCITQISKTVEIKTENHDLYIPNAFTPNDDGLNDYFEIRQTEFCQPIHCSIYNRWGQKVFEQSAFEIKWNGRYINKDAEQGIYFYVVEEGFRKYSGVVAVIR